MKSLKDRNIIWSGKFFKDNNVEELSHNLYYIFTKQYK